MYPMKPQEAKTGLSELETSLGYIVPGQGYMALPWLKNTRTKQKVPDSKYLENLAGLFHMSV